ncbi:MAG: hypothetical protein Q8S13_02795, partial [Dehalococcoidia bacterium]|nr:hypothetical protein [Dehalococcoidia bacterium]
GGVLFWTTRNVFLRGLGIFMPIGQLTAIVFTANHYIFDAMAGLLVGLMGLLIAMALQYAVYPWARRLVRRLATERRPKAAPAAGTGPPD